MDRGTAAWQPSRISFAEGETARGTNYEGESNNCTVGCKNGFRTLITFLHEMEKQIP